MKKILFIILSVLFILPSFSETKKNTKKHSSINLKNAVDVSTSQVTGNNINNEAESKKSENTSVNENNNLSDEDEKSEVLIDRINYDEKTSYSESSEDMNNLEKDPDALGYSYGQIRGVMNLEGKPVIVLEADDGTINFIYVFMDRGKIKWKLYGRIKRSY